MKSKFRLALSLIVSFALFGLTACEREQQEAEPEEPSEKAEKQKKEQTDQESDKEGAVESKPNSSAIPGTLNQLEWDQEIPEVEFSITSPEDGETLDSGEKVEVEFDLEGYRIGPTIGQHVHFVLDNKPYKAHYEAGEPVVFEGLEPGTHTIRAFPSRHYHLSLKKDEPIDTVVFHVEEESEEFEFDPDEPFVTYSRPKGTYSKEAADGILLDFYVSNTELGDDTRVVYSIDGEKEGELKKWAPKLISPGPGEHEINVKLVDGSGEVIENGGYNDTTRTITVEE